MRSAMTQTQKKMSTAGFTLVEILIVVVILGILSAVVIPQFSNASQTARENTLKDDLRYLRVQVSVFMAQHEDVPPGYPGGNVAAQPTEADFIAQITKPTDAKCGISNKADAQYKYGPYLQKMPRNPMNEKSTVLVLGDGQAIPEADGSTGWIYQPETQKIIANTAGSGIDGRAYVEY
jgi:general secretion pathway protein G